MNRIHYLELLLFSNSNRPIKNLVITHVKIFQRDTNYIGVGRYAFHDLRNLLFR